MADDLRQQYEDAIRAACPMGLTLHGVLDAVLAVQDEPVRQEILGPLNARLTVAEAAVARVDSKHRMWRVWTLSPCAHHKSTGWRREVLKCSKCRLGVMSSCTNKTCDSWPCETHLDLYGETEETCAHG